MLTYLHLHTLPPLLPVPNKPYGFDGPCLLTYLGNFLKYFFNLLILIYNAVVIVYLHCLMCHNYAL